MFVRVLNTPTIKSSWNYKIFVVTLMGWMDFLVISSFSLSIVYRQLAYSTYHRYQYCGFKCWVGKSVGVVIIPIFLIYNKGRSIDIIPDTILWLLNFISSVLYWYLFYVIFQLFQSWRNNPTHNFLNKIDTRH